MHLLWIFPYLVSLSKFRIFISVSTNYTISSNDMLGRAFNQYVLFNTCIYLSQYQWVPMKKFQNEKVCTDCCIPSWCVMQHFLWSYSFDCCCKAVPLGILIFFFWFIWLLNKLTVCSCHVTYAFSEWIHTL